MVLFGKMGECLDKGWPIVRDNLNKGALAIKNAFEDPVSKSRAGLIIEHVEFRAV